MDDTRTYIKNMKFDPISPPEVIEFEGVSYRRMGGRRRYYLSQSRTREGKRKAKGLHVAIWESHNGCPVPQGHEVHHKDRDTFNFEIRNLECLPKSIHRAMPKQYSDEHFRHLDRIRPKAAEWHRSPEGLAWHRGHARNSICKPGVDRHPVIGQRSCVWCGEIFTARSSRRKFCVPKCQWEESGYRLGKYKFVHPHFVATAS